MPIFNWNQTKKYSQSSVQNERKITVIFAFTFAFFQNGQRPTCLCHSLKNSLFFRNNNFVPCKCGNQLQMISLFIGISLTSLCILKSGQEAFPRVTGWYVRTLMSGRLCICNTQTRKHLIVTLHRWRHWKCVQFRWRFRLEHQTSCTYYIVSSSAAVQKCIAWSLHGCWSLKWSSLVLTSICP